MGDSTEEESVEEEVGEQFVEDQGNWMDTPWEECIDDEGNVYYYNRETGDSSWDLPQEFRSVLKDTEVTVLRKDSKLLSKVSKEDKAEVNLEKERLATENADLLFEIDKLKETLKSQKAQLKPVEESNREGEGRVDNETRSQLLGMQDRLIAAEVNYVLCVAASTVEVEAEAEARKKAEKDRQSLELERENLLSEAERLEQELEETREEMSNSEQWLDKLRMELFEYEEALNTEREKVSEVEEKMRQLQEERAKDEGLARNNAEVVEAGKKKDLEITRLTGLLKSEKEQNAEALKSEQEKLQVAQSRLQEAKVAASAEIEDNARAREELKKKDAEISKLTELLKSAEAEGSKEAQEVHSQLEAKDKEISRLQNILEAGKDEADKQVQKLKKHLEQIEKQKSANEGLLEKLKKAEEESKQLQTKLQQAESAKSEAIEALALAKREDTELALRTEQARIKELEKAIDSWKSKLEATVATKDQAVAALTEQHKQAVQQTEREVADLKAALQSANRTLDHTQGSLVELQQQKDSAVEDLSKHQAESQKQIRYVVENLNQLREEYTLTTLSDQMCGDAIVSALLEVGGEIVKRVYSELQATKTQLQEQADSVSLLRKHEEETRCSQKQQLQERLSLVAEELEKQRTAEALLRQENSTLSQQLNDSSSIIESLQRKYEKAHERTKAAEAELASAAEVTKALDEEVNYLTEQKRKLSLTIISTKAEANTAVKEQLGKLLSECQVLQLEAKTLKKQVVQQMANTLERVRSQAESFVSGSHLLRTSKKFNLLRCVRLRPKRLSGPWSSNKEKALLEVVNNRELRLNKSALQSKRWMFDAVYSSQKSREIFDNLGVAKAIDEVRTHGGRMCILCYGQSNSGKTHSIYGNVFDPGLLTLSMEHLEQERVNVRITARKLLADQVVDLSIDALESMARTDADYAHHVYTLGFENGGEVSFVDLADSARISRKACKRTKEAKLKSLGSFDTLRSVIRQCAAPFANGSRMREGYSGALERILGLEGQTTGSVTVLLIVHISSEHRDADESCCSLNYATSLTANAW